MELNQLDREIFAHKNICLLYIVLYSLLQNTGSVALLFNVERSSHFLYFRRRRVPTKNFTTKISLLQYT
jgi:hypothetical protein